MSGIPLFRDCFALKGGTAINLVCFNLPRLSVDIDLDFTRFGRMPELLPLRKEIKSALFDLLQSRGYTVGKLGKELHTLDQWTFNYRSIAGNNDHIKMELNYGIRNHFLLVVSKEINPDIVPDAGIRFPTLHPCELFTTKINALIERRPSGTCSMSTHSHNRICFRLSGKGRCLKKELSSIRPSGWKEPPEKR
nr:nucleotidyl transferase AbiEii/AbiGii toxin family protein [Bacteroides thetaiotaomicron]